MEEEDDGHPVGQLLCGIKVAFTLPDGIITVHDFGLSPPNDDANSRNNSDNDTVTGSSSASKVNPPDNNLSGGERNVTSQVAYTGRHDHGLLPPPRQQEGPYAQLIGNVLDAKEFSNAFLTNVMKQETNRSMEPPNSDARMEMASKKHKPNQSD